jgi:hypothetical protein
VTSVNVALAPRSRFGVLITASDHRYEVPDHQEFAGTDLTQTLSRSEYKVTVVPKVRVTAKTSLLVGGDYELDRFPFLGGRDADSNRLFAGFEVASATRLEGRLVAGARSFRLTRRSGEARGSVIAGYGDADLWYHVGPRTSIEARYLRDLSYSAFAVEGETPTLTTEVIAAQLDKDLWLRFNLRVFGSYNRLKTAGAVAIRRATGETVAMIRNDKVREGGLDFGYKFRGSLRIGIAAIYTERLSTFEDFGIKGLLVGGTISLGRSSYTGNWPR